MSGHSCEWSEGKPKWVLKQRNKHVHVGRTQNSSTFVASLDYKQSILCRSTSSTGAPQLFPTYSIYWLPSFSPYLSFIFLSTSLFSFSLCSSVILETQLGANSRHGVRIELELGVLRADDTVAVVVLTDYVIRPVDVATVVEEVEEAVTHCGGW